MFNSFLFNDCYIFIQWPVCFLDANKTFLLSFHMRGRLYAGINILYLTAWHQSVFPRTSFQSFWLYILRSLLIPTYLSPVKNLWIWQDAHWLHPTNRYVNGTRRLLLQRNSSGETWKLMLMSVWSAHIHAPQIFCNAVASFTEKIKHLSLP